MRQEPHAVIAALREFMRDFLDKVDWPLLLALCG